MMTRKRWLFGCLLLGSEALAQCNITVVSKDSGPVCVSGSRMAFTYLSWTGGTPPFTVELPGTTLNTNQSPVNTGVAVPAEGMAPASFDGTGNWGYTITDALGCTANGQFTVAFPFPWVYDDAVNAFAVQPMLVDTVNGVYNVALLDNAADGGTPFTAFPAYLNYTFSLAKNGAVVASGPFSSVLQEGPTRLLFSGLTSGSYVCNYTLDVDLDHHLCPPEGSIAFVLTSPGDVNANVRIRAALQGALPSGTLMNDGLRAAGQLPLTEPYSALGYTYSGTTAGATIPASMLSITGNDALVDWVVVELRSAITPTTVLFSKPALIQRDGDVIDTDGDVYVSTSLAPGSYRIALRHRNHFGVMSAASYSLATSPAMVDFRVSSTLCYGTSPRALVGSVYGLWAGDANADGSLKYTGANNDRDPILIAVGGTTPNNTLGPVYDRRDVNLDGVIKYTGANNDRDPILVNIGGTVPTNTRSQQLP